MQLEQVFIWHHQKPDFIVHKQYLYYINFV